VASDLCLAFNTGGTLQVEFAGLALVACIATCVLNKRLEDDSTVRWAVVRALVSMIKGMVNVVRGERSPEYEDPNRSLGKVDFSLYTS
jgi:hypothetical protein